MAEMTGKYRNVKRPSGEAGRAFDIPGAMCYNLITSIY